jgi:UDP-glucose 4-epimerase
VHVSDIVQGVLLASEKVTLDFDVFNISNPDFVDVNEIASAVMSELEIDPLSVELTYSGGERGWKADVPIVRIDAKKITDLGWSPNFTSHEAIRESIREMKKSKYS